MKKIFLSLLFTVCCAVSSFAQFGNFDVNVRYDVFGYTVPLSLNGDALFLPENYHSENRTWFVPLESQVAVLDFEEVIGRDKIYKEYKESTKS